MPSPPPCERLAPEVGADARARLAGSAALAALECAEARVEAALGAYARGARRPVMGLDFEGLYPSIISTCNLSPEKFVATGEEARRLEAAGLGAAGLRQRHDSFEILGARVEGWFVLHGGDPARYGLYPRILQEFRARRAAAKALLAAREGPGGALGLSLAHELARPVRLPYPAHP